MCITNMLCLKKNIQSNPPYPLDLMLSLEGVWYRWPVYSFALSWFFSGLWVVIYFCFHHRLLQQEVPLTKVGLLEICRYKLTPNFLRSHHTVCQSGCTSLCSHQQWRNVSLTPHPLQHKLSSVFLILALLTGIKWYLKVTLICISLVIKDVEQFLKRVSAIWNLLRILFKPVSHF